MIIPVILGEYSEVTRLVTYLKMCVPTIYFFMLSTEVINFSLVKMFMISWRYRELSLSRCC